MSVSRTRYEEFVRFYVSEQLTKEDIYLLERRLFWMILQRRDIY